MQIAGNAGTGAVLRCAHCGLHERPTLFLNPSLFLAAADWSRPRQDAKEVVQANWITNRHHQPIMLQTKGLSGTPFEYMQSVCLYL